jgi:hypothetical protein
MGGARLHLELSDCLMPACDRLGVHALHLCHDHLYRSQRTRLRVPHRSGEGVRVISPRQTSVGII